MSRAPISDLFDAIVDLEPRGSLTTHAYALVKQVFTVVDGQAVIAAAEPLKHDLRDEAVAKTFPVGSDFWTFKRATDVVIQGSAHSPVRGVGRAEARCDVGARTKRIAVFGQRFIEWTTGGRPYVGPPVAIESVPLTNAFAYGGADTRVPFKVPDSLAGVLEFAATYPGIYPRNPFGKGYYVVPDRTDGIELPNLEDPEDLLTDERLILGDPARWHFQPLPWSFDWRPMAMFPRLALMGKGTRLPPEGTDLAEVRRGMIPANYRSAADDFDLRQRFYQEASLGMSFAPLEPGTPISMQGMHPEGKTIAVALPPPPALEFEIEGARHLAKPQLTNAVLHPGEERMSLVYYARTELPRAFIPGVHRTIPVAVRVDRGDPIRYDAPPTVRDRLIEAMNRPAGARKGAKP